MMDMELPYVRTGYELVIPHRVGKTFCQMAEKDGKVVSVTKFGVIVEYSDGEKEGFKAGVQYGKAEGTLYPSNLITNLSVGDKFKAGDPMVWNEQFFEFDIFSQRLAYKHTRMGRLALLEGEQTYEDSCAASTDFVNGIASKITKLRDIRIDFGDVLHDVLLPGTDVKAADFLMIIQEAATAGLEVSDVELRKSLSNLTQNAPKAKYDGKIERIEVFYNGSKEAMSESVRKLCDASDRELKKRAKESGSKVFSGEVTSNYRSNGKTLTENTAEIRVYIEVLDKAGNSDKIVFAHQLKTTIGEIEEPTKTESGLPIDVKFSRIAVDARIVGSFDEIAVLGTCMDIIPPHIEKLWKM